MRKHNGMRPQDVAILLKIAAKKGESWTMKELASELFISASEVTESLSRNVYSGLLNSDKKQIMKTDFINFLKSGLKLVFPVKVSAIGRGMTTAYSTKPLSNMIQSSEKIVWSYATGKEKGMVIEPLIPSIPKACEIDSNFYELVALVDALRIGKVREVNLAYEELNKRL